MDKITDTDVERIKKIIDDHKSMGWIELKDRLWLMEFLKQIIYENNQH